MNWRILHLQIVQRNENLFNLKISQFAWKKNKQNQISLCLQLGGKFDFINEKCIHTANHP